VWVREGSEVQTGKIKLPEAVFLNVVSRFHFFYIGLYMLSSNGKIQSRSKVMLDVNMAAVREPTTFDVDRTLKLGQ